MIISYFQSRACEIRICFPGLINNIWLLATVIHLVLTLLIQLLSEIRDSASGIHLLVASVIHLLLILEKSSFVIHMLLACVILLLLTSGNKLLSDLCDQLLSGFLVHLLLTTVIQLPFGLFDSAVV